MTREPETTRPSRLARNLMLAWIAAASVLTLLALYGAGEIGGPVDYFMWVQDFPVLLGVTAVLLVMTLAPAVERGRLAQRLLDRPFACAVVLAALLAAVAWWGRDGVFGGFAFSRDEDLALFQARLIAKGRLLVEVPEAWRASALALQPLFFIQLPGNPAWLSGYLPVNSALHAAGLTLGAEPLVSPLLAALAVVATYGVGRKLWPDQRGLALLAAGLLATSAQLVVTAMTAYAMTAHLAFNMAWLWLFLRGGRAGHLGAIAVGALAVGLHQLIFHPLFVAPFILQLWLDRRWRLAAGYTGAYAVICLGWIYYWTWAAQLAGAASQAAGDAGGARIGHQVAALLLAANFEAVAVMAKHLVRFISWQNPLTAPLFLLGLVASLRSGGHRRALLLGLVITTLAMTILLPSQTHGWGYRYLHGFLGAAALLAAWTWADLRRRIPGRSEAILFTGFAAALLLAALRTDQAKAYVQPYRSAFETIRATPADAVIVFGDQIASGIALVRNDPWLRARPLTLDRAALRESRIAGLCAHHVIGVYQASDAARAGVVTLNEPVKVRQEREAHIMADLLARGCRIAPIPR